MSLKTFFQTLNVFRECKRNRLPLRQCPSFLFLIMGLIIIAVILITYYIGINYIAVEMLILILGISTVVLLIVAHTITASFERVAQANRMKSEFVSIVSHQLRTPLSSLRWSLNLLQGKRLGELNEKQKEYLEVIKESNLRMIGLVNDLLNVNRIEEGRFSVKPELFSLEELVESVIQELTPLAKEKQVELKFTEKDHFSKVYADPQRTRMVVQNLIDNAIKYSKEETSQKWVKVSLVNEDGSIKFVVEDNGIGIPASMQKQVFGKFFRGRKLIKQKVEGTGLGLFIAKGIIEISGGEIDFKSREGKGSTFWFRLPIRKKIKEKKVNK